MHRYRAPCSTAIAGIKPATAESAGLACSGCRASRRAERFADKSGWHASPVCIQDEVDAGLLGKNHHDCLEVGVCDIQAYYRIRYVIRIDRFFRNREVVDALFYIFSRYRD